MSRVPLDTGVSRGILGCTGSLPLEECINRRLGRGWDLGRVALHAPVSRRVFSLAVERVPASSSRVFGRGRLVGPGGVAGTRERSNQCGKRRIACGRIDSHSTSSDRHTVKSLRVPWGHHWAFASSLGPPIAQYYPPLLPLSVTAVTHKWSNLWERCDVPPCYRQRPAQGKGARIASW